MQQQWKIIPKSMLLSCVMLVTGCGGENGSQNVTTRGVLPSTTEQQSIVITDKTKTRSYSLSGAAVKGPLAFAAIYAYQFDGSKPEHFDNNAPIASTITDANGEFNNLQISSQFKPPFVVVAQAGSSIDTNTGRAPVLSTLINVITPDMLAEQTPIYATPLTTIAFHVAAQASTSETAIGFLSNLSEAAIQVRDTFGLGMSNSIDVLTMSPLLTKEAVANSKQHEVAEYRAASEALATIAYTMAQSAPQSQISADEIVERLALDLASDGSMDNLANGEVINGVDVSILNQDIGSVIIANTNIAIKDIEQLLIDESLHAGIGENTVAEKINLNLSPIPVKIDTSPGKSHKAVSNMLTNENGFFSGDISMDSSTEYIDSPTNDEATDTNSSDEMSDYSLMEEDSVTPDVIEAGLPENDLLLSPEIVTTSRILIPRSARWKYLDNGKYPGTNWKNINFDDSLWQSGSAEFGYGDGDEKTKLSFGPNASNKYITTYFRSKFAVANPAKVGELHLKLLRDDGAVLYLNGNEIVRSNMPSGTITKDTKASSTVLNDAEKTFYVFKISPDLLKTGDNILTAEVHQHSINNIDVSFSVELENAIGSPTLTPVEGNYNSAIDVVIKSASSEAIIRYTTDGSEPTNRSTIYTKALRLSRTTTLKAKAYYGEVSASGTTSANYVITSARAIVPTSVLPMNSAKEVITNETITANLGNVNNIIIDQFTLTTAGNNVDGISSIKDSKIMFNPNAPLLYNRIYTAKILASMQDNATGESLTTDYSWTFTTINPDADWIVFYNDLNNDYPHVYTDRDLRDKWNFNYGRSAGIAEGRVSVVKGDTASQNNMLQIRYEAGAHGPSKNGVQWRVDIGKHDDLYMSYSIKFNEGFDFVRGGKIPGLVGGSTTSGVKPNGTDFFIGRMMFIPLGKIIQYVYHLNQANIHGDGISWTHNNTPQKQFIPGKWHRIENHVKMNTPGKSDGVIETWFDGELSLRRTNFKFRTTNDLKIDQFFFSTFFGGSDSTWAPKKREYMYMDNVIVSKKPIAH